ncbi:MAG: hypothetical protein Hyperionvirus26_9 [Hyperionvirus sp.]|uniref:RING-type domain-containing protein n=1 Tax=Hyperionvirus sp. TaxID=2487770 RepID=A0A3G5ACX1_9VIRU|nr:MAG: hypothetical protein Hyperionvirus26_9 [Hyperionvirus sp.]
MDFKKAKDENGLVGLNSADPKIFVLDLDPDLLCRECRRVPRRPFNTQCCGRAFCQECITRKRLNDPACPHCNQPWTQEVIVAPYVSQKLCRKECRCVRSPYFDTETNTEGKSGCMKTILFGQEGSTYMKHVMEECEFMKIDCPDCKQSFTKVEFAFHKPDSDPCPNKPKKCYMCDVNVPISEFAAHERLVVHQENIKKKMASLVMDVCELRESQKTMEKDYCEKIANVRKDCDQKIAEVHAAHEARFVEMIVPKWSEVKQGVELISEATATEAWGFKWWLKVKKGPTYIELYLCRGDEKGTVPVDVDYQLLCRDLKSDDGVCASVVYRTSFGKEKAWGLSKYITLDELEKDGAYSKIGDTIAFGCIMWPQRNLKWGHKVRKPPSNVVVAAARA